MGASWWPAGSKLIVKASRTKLGRTTNLLITKENNPDSVRRSEPDMCNPLAQNEKEQNGTEQNRTERGVIFKSGEISPECTRKKLLNANITNIFFGGGENPRCPGVFLYSPKDLCLFN